jgi:hypothetical protein
MDLASWFIVSFDEIFVYLDVHAPKREGWKAQIQWIDIIRVCFKPGALFSPDELYIFTKSRPESYLIPLEANGALKLWNEIINRKLFSAELAIKIASEDQGVYCWPENND